ncbi:hypothetical protein EON65_49300 [archaeon]|nr:MAG: hypothetical protein EON65_49300 [archaeon]
MSLEVFAPPCSSFVLLKAVLMSELDRIRAKIEATEAKLKKAEEDERTEAYLTSLQITLAKQQETLNLLLAQSAPAPG